MKPYILKFNIPLKREGLSHNYAELPEGYNQQAIQKDSIPSYFISFKLWPKTTTLLCWNCIRSFDNYPIAIPIEKIIVMKDKYRNVLEIDNGYLMFKTMGNFCTFNCAMRHLLHTFKEKSKEDAVRNMLLMVKLFCNKSLKNIEPAEPHTSQLRFGGTTSEEEYKAQLDAINPFNIESNANTIKMTMIIDDDIGNLDLKTN